MRRIHTGKIMPRQKGTGPLDLVIAIMAFLAALALGAALIASRTAITWQSGLSGKITVQILPQDGANALSARADLKGQTDAVVALLRATPGIAYARPLREEEELALLKPWIGDAQSIEDLPLPQLIDADLVPGQHIDIAALRSRLRQVSPDAHLDDHSQWMSRLRDFAGSIIWSAYGILLLIALATMATVSFATRAGLESHRDMVALLHQMGSQGSFIARLFKWHYARAAFGASALGVIFAAGLFLAAGGLQVAGIEAVPFLPPLALLPFEFLWLILVPVAAGAIGLITARLSVWLFLKKIY
ncbi:MAG: hypothetical protein WCD42_11650 [Rhizomicrobium sp.]